MALQTAEIKNCFNLFDREGQGRIDVRMIGTLVRSLGMNPTEESLRKVAGQIIGGSTFGADDLSKVLTKLRQDNAGFTEDDIREAFRVFDRDGNGFVSVTELRHVMTNLGERLSDEEADEMIRQANVDQDGLVNYEDWVQLMFR